MRMHWKSRPGREYLTIEVSGVFDYHQVVDHIPEMLDACAEHQAAKVLVDALGVSGTVTLAERFLYADTLARLYKRRRVDGTLQHVQFAYVADPPILDAHRFGEKVATSRGLHVKAVPTMDEAWEWLHVQPLKEK